MRDCRPAPGSREGAGGAMRGSWATGRAAPLRLGVREPVEATQLAPPPQLSLVPHTPCVSGVCVGKVPGRRYQQRLRLIYRLQARRASRKFDSAVAGSHHGWGHFPVQRPLLLSLPPPGVATDAHAASGSGVTDGTPGRSACVSRGMFRRTFPVFRFQFPGYPVGARFHFVRGC